MDELIEIHFDGKVQKVTRENAIDYALFQEAVKGNVSAAKEAARRRRERARVANDNTADTLLSAENAALERLIKRQVEQRRASDKPNQDGPGDKPNRFKAAANKFVPGGKK